MFREDSQRNYETWIINKPDECAKKDTKIGKKERKNKKM